MNAHVLEPYLLPIAVRQHKLAERRALALVFGVAALIGAALFSLGVTFNAGFDVSLSTQTNPTTGKAGPALKFAVTTLDIEYSVIDSSIGSISTSGLQKLTNLLLPFVKDVINAVGGIGFPLPALGGLAFSGSAIVIQENALAINTNITYTP